MFKVTEIRTTSHYGVSFSCSIGLQIVLLAVVALTLSCPSPGAELSSYCEQPHDAQRVTCRVALYRDLDGHCIPLSVSRVPLLKNNLFLIVKQLPNLRDDCALCMCCYIQVLQTGYRDPS